MREGLGEHGELGRGGGNGRVGGGGGRVKGSGPLRGEGRLDNVWQSKVGYSDRRVPSPDSFVVTDALQQVLCACNAAKMPH